jgi:hypothetical protein
MTAFIVVMVCAIAAGWLAERIRVPYPIVLVLAGIGVGLAYGGLGLELDPQIGAGRRAARGSLSGGGQHVLARFPRAPAPDPLARHRARDDDDPCGRPGFQVARAGSALGGRVRARRRRLAAGCRRRDGDPAAIPPPALDRHAARRARAS